MRALAGSSRQLSSTLERAFHGIAASSTLCQRSRASVLDSRLLSFAAVKPRRWIGGGSESSPVLELRASVEARLGNCSLEPLDGARVWGGPPSGNICHVCEQAIVAPQMEYELDAAPRRFLHVMCYTVWLEESRRLIYHQNGPQR